MKSLSWRFMLTGLVLVAMTVMLSGEVAAQCATCAAPTVAYQPVAVQPAVAYRPYTGWYPGKLLDQWRMRGATTPAYTASYSPYTAAYAPSYTAAYSPAYTAAYTPYVSSYAPLSAPVASGCNTCSHTAYYPLAQTLSRQVVLRQVVAPACNTCSYTPSCECSSCCSTGVSQAAYVEPAYAAPGCSSCAGGSASHAAPSVPYQSPNSYESPNVGPPTPQPRLEPEPAPQGPSYRSNKHPARPGDLDAPAKEEADPFDEFDPGPAGEVDPSTYFNAPRLLDPSDRTAVRSRSRKPTVDVWQAVYRKPATASQVSQTSARRARTQAEIDAEGWAPVRRNR